MGQNNNKKQVLEFLRQLGDISSDESDTHQVEFNREKQPEEEDLETDTDNRFDQPPSKLLQSMVYMKSAQEQQEPQSMRNVANELQDIMITEKNQQKLQFSDQEGQKQQFTQLKLEEQEEQKKQQIKPAISELSRKPAQSNIFAHDNPGMVIGREGRPSDPPIKKPNPKFGKVSFVLGCGHQVRRRKMEEFVKGRTQGFYFPTKADKIGEKLVKCPYCFYILKTDDIEMCFETEEDCQKHLEDANLRMIQKLKQTVKHDQECLLCDSNEDISAVDNDHWLCKECWKDFALHYWSQKGYRSFDKSFKFDQKIHKIVCPVPGCRFNLIEHEITKEIKEKLFPRKGCSIF